MIPFHLVYRGEAVDPVKIGMSSGRVNAYNKDNAKKKRSLELDLVEESRDKATVQLKMYK